MFKRFSHFSACLLLLLMPLQSIAAANMLICNNIMLDSRLDDMAKTQSVSQPQQMQNMPCHKDMIKQDTHKSEQQQSPCKTVCATLCASLNTIATLPVNISAANFHLSTPLLNLPNQVYASITQPSLQRPPNFFS